MKNVLLIINPNSGKLKGKTMLFDIINIMSQNDCQVTVKITQKAGDATTFASEACLSNMYDIIVCSGGDGTLNETVSGIAGVNGNIGLGYIPSGSTNDYAKSMGLSQDIKEATLRAINGESHPTDIGCLNGTYFNYIASFGVFTAVSYNTSRNMKKLLGHLAYVLAGIKDIAKIKSCHAIIEHDGEIYEDDYIFGALANTTSIGGLVHIKETLVEFNDGLFEVCFVKKPKGPSDLIRIIMGALNSDFSCDCFESFKASKLNIKVPENTTWSLDGERYIGESNLNFEVIKSAINIIF
ncbi:MAG: diacylglycerol kinase family lipid kinase [Clostridia bacterium]|nr:diacylglycerol kinase family lipid kinase [Clostridia bacterium]